MTVNNESDVKKKMEIFLKTQKGSIPATSNIGRRAVSILKIKLDNEPCFSSEEEMLINEELNKLVRDRFSKGKA